MTSPDMLCFTQFVPQVLHTSDFIEDFRTYLPFKIKHNNSAKEILSFLSF
jgi:hypothetical protein